LQPIFTTESTIGPADKITVDGKDAGKVEGSPWACDVKSYLPLDRGRPPPAIEWLTYHRRVTV
jgi:hypothetical protein